MTTSTTFVRILLFLSAALPAAEVELIGGSAAKPSWAGGFLSWSSKETGLNGEVFTLRGQDGKGGLAVTVDFDSQSLLDLTPVVRLRTVEGNQAKFLILRIADADDTTHDFRIPLPAQPSQDFVDVMPPDCDAMREPELPLKGKDAGTVPGLGRIAKVVLVGPWTDEPVAVDIQSVRAIPADPTMQSKREQIAIRKAQRTNEAKRSSEAAEQARKDLLANGAPHGADGVQVVQVCAVAPDTLAVTLQAGQQVNFRMEAYVPQAGDQIEEKTDPKDPYREVIDGKIVEIPRKRLFRTVDGKRTEIGLMSPDGKHVVIEGKTTGQRLDERAVADPSAYRITSATDPAFATEQQPQAVHWKGKPNGNSQPMPFQYVISLTMAKPLQEGATYTIRFHAVNTSTESIDYRHVSRENHSLAVHAIQTGYRPDEPYKRGFVSFWMGVDRNGKQGSIAHEVKAFELIDASGKAVFTGTAELARGEGTVEQLTTHDRDQGDLAKARVYRLDFSSFATPGTYRLHVPGIGTSYPFDIGRDVWKEPFVAAMQGILAQRQGIDLDRSFSSFARKRTFHPDDGVQYYQLDIAVFEGQEGERGDSLIRLAEKGALQRVDGTPGAYQDAGDWDTLSHHLQATYDLLELALVFPQQVAAMKLKLPPQEAANAMPDIVDEAMWQMPTWRKLQLPDGSVRGGYGYGWGCPKNMVSGMIRSVGIYAPDHVTTMHFAAAAARAARVLKPLDAKASEGWLADAKRAWAWAEANANDANPTYARLKARKSWPDFTTELANCRAMAAVELFAATGDAAYDGVFRTNSEFAQANPGMYMDPLQMKAAYAYALLPEGTGDAALKAKIKARFIAYADSAIAWSTKNAYDVIAGRRPDLPLIGPCTWLSTPGQGGNALLYAYEFGGDRRHLAAAVQGSNFCLGANPQQLCYISGVGENPTRYPFFLDAKYTNQWPNTPVGHIPYGQGNEGGSMASGANAWVQTWFLNFEHATKMVPNWYDWPVYEQYIDFSVYPMLNENCFDQTTVPAACYWFRLAHRK